IKGKIENEVFKSNILYIDAKGYNNLDIVEAMIPKECIKLYSSNYNDGINGYIQRKQYAGDKTFYDININGEILKDEIRTMEVSNNVSNVAKIKEVRYLMVDVQRNIGKVSSVILDGRDIGSYVFPNADYKFFLVATPEERGKRRYKEKS
ncbi:MAG: (d)CMP kinase, partial [Serratia marcescens]|nr:(d)CMP kinase [Serratia marcescens]